MSVKTIWERPMRKDFFTSPWQERDRGKGGRKVKRKTEREGRGKKKAEGRA